MTGYQEILTDPSYKGQIITMTYPLIGNYGVNEQDVESYQTHASGFVVRELSPVVSNYRADSSRARRKTTGMCVTGQTYVRRRSWHLATFAGILAGWRERRHARASQRLK